MALALGSCHPMHAQTTYLPMHELSLTSEYLYAITYFLVLSTSKRQGSLKLVGLSLTIHA